MHTCCIRPTPLENPLRNVGSHLRVVAFGQNVTQASIARTMYHSKAELRHSGLHCSLQYDDAVVCVGWLPLGGPSA